MSISSKTPSSATAKTAWARSPGFWLGCLAFGIIVTLSVLSIFLAGANHDTTLLHAGGKTYTLDIARTTAVQTKGLGGRKSLPQSQGMLFAFTDTRPRCFWMKDMRIPLDIIWLGTDKRVLHIQPNVSPATYPAAFCPPQPARYVIEISAGQAKAASIHTGEALTF